MAYKFQNGEAILSGSLLQEGNIEIDTGFSLKVHDQTVIDTSRNIANVVNIDASGDLTVGTITGPSPFSVDASGDVIADSFKTDGNEFVVSTAGAITAMGLDNSAQGITNAGAVAGVTTLDASGLASLDGGINVADAMTVSAAGVVSGSGALSVGADATIAGDVSPLTDGAYDLGSSSKEWKDLYIDGVAYVDELRADLLGAALDANSQAITNINVDSGAIDGVVIGANSQAAAEFTTISGSGALSVGADATIQGDVQPLTDGAYDLGSSSKEWKDLYIDGVAYIDSLQADQLGKALDANNQAITNINVDSGVIDNTEIGVSTPSTGKFTTLSASSTLQAAGTVSGYGNADFGGSVTAGSSFIIGSADLNETDMEKLDGITNGTVAANKAVVVDGNLDASGFRSITASANVVANKLFGDGAGITNINVENLDAAGSDTQIQFNQNGEFAANANFTYDGSGSVSTSVMLSSADLKATNLTSGRLPLVSTSGKLADDAQFSYDTGRNLNGYNNIAVSSSASGSSYLGDGLLYIADQSEVDILVANGQGVGMGYDSTLQSGEGDNVFFFAPSTGDVKLQYDGAAVFFGKDSDVNLAHVADTGLLLNSTRQLQFGDSGTYIHQSADGVLDLVADSEIEINATTIDVNGILDVSGNSTLGGTLTAASLGSIADADIDLTADLMIANDSATGAIKNMSLANYAGKLAGGSNEGLSSTAGRLGVDLNDLSEAAIADGDYLAFIDSDGSNATKKEAVADLADLFAGTGLKAVSSVMALDVNELSQAAVASGDFFVIEDATDNSTKKESVDDLATLFAGTGLAAASAVLSLDLNELSALGSAGVVAADQLAFVDATDDATKKVTMANFLESIAGAGISYSNGQLITDGGAVTLAANGVALSEGYNYCADISGAGSSISCPLPASPTVGDVVHLKAGSLASGKTVAATVQGSHFIDGDLSSITLESSHAAASLVYVAANAWRLV